MRHEAQQVVESYERLMLCFTYAQPNATTDKIFSVRRYEYAMARLTCANCSREYDAACSLCPGCGHDRTARVQTFAPSVIVAGSDPQTGGPHSQGSSVAAVAMAMTKSKYSRSFV